MDEFRSSVYKIVALIPYGRVVSYGDIARAAGYPNHARHVGKALSQIPESSDLPWHRVVNAKGEVSARSPWSSNAGNEITQRILLEEEGITFVAGRVAAELFIEF